MSSLSSRSASSLWRSRSASKVRATDRERRESHRRTLVSRVADQRGALLECQRITINLRDGRTNDRKAVSELLEVTTRT